MYLLTLIITLPKANIPYKIHEVCFPDTILFPRFLSIAPSGLVAC